MKYQVHRETDVTGLWITLGQDEGFAEALEIINKSRRTNHKLGLAYAYKITFINRLGKKCLAAYWPAQRLGR